MIGFLERWAAGPNFPNGTRARKTELEPESANSGVPEPPRVPATMERREADPMEGRDPMDTPEGIPWAEWKAAALNRLFQEQGVTGQPGRITAETVRHGERKWSGNG
jgi:hypothetical protein